MPSKHKTLAKGRRGGVSESLTISRGHRQLETPAKQACSDCEPESVRGPAQTHSVAQQYVRDDTLSCLGTGRVTGGREQPDAVPDCALVHGENLPVTGHTQLGWSRAHFPHPDTDTVRTKAPPADAWSHTHTSEWPV